MSFTNKVVIVTGGSSGIGAATAVQFAKEGANVVIVGRNEQRLNKVAEQCQELNADYLIVRADVTNENDVNNIVKETIKKYGKLDILVNNAAILRKGLLLNGEMVKMYDEVMNNNLKSVVVLTSLAVPYLIKTKGNVVNVSSIAGSRVKSPDFMTYSISKAGLNMFTIGSSLEMAPHGVRVNSVSPGPVRTDMIQNAVPNMTMKDWNAVTALGRISESEEVADLILFLASDKAKGITGSNYICDNGTLIYRP